MYVAYVHFRTHPPSARFGAASVGSGLRSAVTRSRGGVSGHHVLPSAALRPVLLVVVVHCAGCLPRLVLRYSSDTEAGACSRHVVGLTRARVLTATPGALGKCAVAPIYTLAVEKRGISGIRRC